jgi:hypothetical protein
VTVRCAILSNVTGHGAARDVGPSVREAGARTLLGVRSCFAAPAQLLASVCSPRLGWIHWLSCISAPPCLWLRSVSLKGLRGLYRSAQPYATCMSSPGTRRAHAYTSAARLRVPCCETSSHVAQVSAAATNVTQRSLYCSLSTSSSLALPSASALTFLRLSLCSAPSHHAGPERLCRQSGTRAECVPRSPCQIKPLKLLSQHQVESRR